MFIIDAHLDLAMNAMEWNRDLRLGVNEIRAREKGMTDKPDRGKGTVSLPALREGGVGLVVATQIARYVALGNPLAGWHSPEQAWAQTQAHLAWYKAMEEEGEMVMIKDKKGLEEHLKRWDCDVDDNQSITSGQGLAPHKKPIGFILSLEGADSLVTLKNLESAHAYGLRAIGPAHYGPGRYANGTDSEGKMNTQGIDLLKKMDELGMILDATHLNDDAFWQALDIYQGNIWASHNNCRAIVDHNRQFSDEMIKALVERNAVIGVALDAWMMVPNWVRGVSTPTAMNCNLGKMVDQIDHICQVAGNTSHVGIGSDLDGAFGKEQCPDDLETIADLNKLPSLLKKRGYTTDDIIAIVSGNFLRFIREALP